MKRFKNPWASVTSKVKKPKEVVHTVQPPRSLLEAIENRNVVCFHYEGTVREVEPYACGVFDNGRTVLRAYQIAGQSKSGKVQGLKTFSIENMDNLLKQTRQFTNIHPEYNPFDSELKHVFAKVK